MKEKLTVEKFLADGNLFVDGDSYAIKSGIVFIVGADIGVASANNSLASDCDRVVLSAKCLEGKEMQEYVKIESPDIFALKDDFESGKLYRSTFHGVKQICTVIDLGSYCQINDIYRKQHWTDKLDGTKERAILCEVWLGERKTTSPILEFIRSINNGIHYCYIGVGSNWPNAEPVPQSMVDFINRK